MKKSRFTEEQIINILREVDAGLKVGEICRKHGISDATYYIWKKKCEGINVSEPLVSFGSSKGARSV